MQITNFNYFSANLVQFGNACKQEKEVESCKPYSDIPVEQEDIERFDENFKNGISLEDGKVLLMGMHRAFLPRYSTTVTKLQDDSYKVLKQPKMSRAFDIDNSGEKILNKEELLKELDYKGNIEKTDDDNFKVTYYDCLSDNPFDSSPDNWGYKTCELSKKECVQLLRYYRLAMTSPNIKFEN